MGLGMGMVLVVVRGVRMGMDMMRVTMFMDQDTSMMGTVVAVITMFSLRVN